MTRSGPLGSVPGGALHYHEPGVWWVRALVAAARNDHGEARRSAVRFAEASARTPGWPWDVNWGAAGLLLGCAQLVESLEDPVVLAPVRAAGQSLAAALTLYRATDEQRWLTAAHRVAADAVRAAAHEDGPADQLFAGELGVMLLAAELEDPARAAMPVYEAIEG
jgi:hypothetical protein